MGWPAWLDDAEQLAERSYSCLDCGVLANGEWQYPKFGGPGCRHGAEAKCSDTPLSAPSSSTI